MLCAPVWAQGNSSKRYKNEDYKEALEQLKFGWEHKPIYNHTQYLHLQEAEKAVASLN